MSAEKKSKLHYSWVILAACFLVYMTVHTQVLQMGSLFTVPMYKDLQVSRTMLALQSVIIALSAVITAPIWGKIYKKHNARYVLALCIGMTCLTIAGRGFMPNMIAILAITVVKGVFFAGSTVLPISILLTAWFQEKRALAISISSLGISLGGVIFSPIVERIISNYGWRMADKVMGGAMFVVLVPVVLLLIRSKPRDMGLEPYGAEGVDLSAAATTQKPALTGMTVAEARRSPMLYLFLIAVFCMTFANGAALQMAAYLTDIGYESATAAKAVSAYSAVAIFGKLLLGAILDKFGDKKGSAYVCITGILTFTCFIFAKQQLFFYGMILFWGLTAGITNVLPTLLTSKIFGNRDYGPIYGMVLSANRFGGVIGNVLVSVLYDITKSYSIIWPVCIACMVFTLVSILFCLRRADKMRAAEAVQN